MARVRVKINDDGMRDLYRQVASKVSRVDVAFRAQWEGQDAAAIQPHVKAAFARIGVNLPSATIADYAAAVSKRQPFEWKLK